MDAGAVLGRFEPVRAGWSLSEPVPAPHAHMTITALQELPLAWGVLVVGWEQRPDRLRVDGTTALCATRQGGNLLPPLNSPQNELPRQETNIPTESQKGPGVPGGCTYWKHPDPPGRDCRAPTLTATATSLR